jgi:hypothetical protein
VTPSVAPLNVYPTLPVTNNSPPPPQSWGYLGNYIRTNFGYSPQVQINVIGTPPGSNQKQTFALTPTFDEYRNAVTTPGIQNYTVLPNDSSQTSDVQFNPWGFLLQPSEASKVEPSPSELRLGDSNDGFVVLSYLTFANPGGPSFKVDFVVEALFTLYETQSQGGWIGKPWNSSATVDLVAATQLAPIS